MVLLHALGAVARRLRIRLAVLHLNHRLRGNSSQADERFVRRIARDLRVPFVTETADVNGYSAREGLSIEMAARRLRHEFFARAAHRLKCSTVALAHHADDQVELFFLRLLRGSSVTGLAGMAPRSPCPADAKVTLVRPLLAMTRESIREYAARQGVVFREDASNRSLEFHRNRVRRQLLPFLRQRFQPALNRIVLRLMDILRAEDVFMADSLLHRPATPFKALPLALKRRWIADQLSRNGVQTDFDTVERLIASQNKRFAVARGAEFPGGSVAKTIPVMVSRDETGRITFARERQSFVSDRTEVRVDRGGSIEFGGCKVEWKTLVGRGLSMHAQSSRGEVFDGGMVGPRIVLRHWQPGDRFQPIGMPESVKLQDLLTNAKVPAEKRRELVLAEAAPGEIFWVEGLRISERFKLTGGSKRGLLWRWNRI